MEERSKRRFFLELVESESLDHLVVLAEGAVDEMKPRAPVEEGSEVELALVEVGLYDSHAAVGKIADYEVNVPGTATLVGKKVKVRIERALAGGAYASLAEPGRERYQPLTAESMAERPTRAPAKKASGKAPAEPEPVAEPLPTERVVERPPRVQAKKVSPKASAEPPSVAEPPAAENTEATITTVAPGPGSESQAGESQPRPKKRTRRGSRGGRRRHKPSQASTTSATANETPG